MNNVQRILKDAFTLLEEGDAWTQGQAVRKNSKGKMSYCAIGAVTHVKDVESIEDIEQSNLAMSLLDIAAMQEGCRLQGFVKTRPAATLNDNAQDFSEVRGMFKRAIDLAGEWYR